MSRSRRSARDAGSRFERSVADYLARVLGDSEIDRQIRTGKDKGDIRGLFLHGERLVLECKDCQRMDLPGWMREAEAEAGNADAPWWAVCHKRRGKGDPAEQYVTMNLRTLAAIVAGGFRYLEEETDE